MSKKVKVGIVYGGQSPEHNISLLSAYNVFKNINLDRYTPVLLPIDKAGNWYYQEGDINLTHPTDAQMVSLPTYRHKVYISQNAQDGSIVDAATGEVITTIDILYPVLHGAYGEDGAIQGLAKIAGLPCVGCSILGSAAGMDKDVTKRLLRDAGIGIAKFVTLRQGYNDHLSYDEIRCDLGSELFIKPANLGSSVGISFVENAEDFKTAVAHAFLFDPKVIIEEKIVGREIECAVMGNADIRTSTIGEILPKTEWYTFENKYVDDDGAGLSIPADIGRENIDRARDIASRAYRSLECCGLARVDMFLKDDGEIIVNEINTLPGFTKISMYPKLWAQSGIAYQDLISKLIEYAIEHFNIQNNLKVAD